ncbi:uncharacterized protein LOC112047581 [Bicyclus anynana]|uniref:Uncharacterized protein LOC112047581 n=1 Tax=Bicyclus anynana TaxID=110368 RepID=A0ABM3LFI9_BICAN|nr:uncharacterized protein LOC112047581 [Bicyclus anynana]
MFKLISVLILAVLVTDCIGQRPHLIFPTYRPPPQPRQPVIRTARDAPSQEPLWLYQGDIPRAPSSADNGVLPQIIDDVRFNPDRRYARSVGPSSGSEHRLKRSPFFPRDPPGFPRPRPSPYDPFPRPVPTRMPFPIYANAKHFIHYTIVDTSTMLKITLLLFVGAVLVPQFSCGLSKLKHKRDVSFPGISKPTHRDIIIPNWNPHARTKPWQAIGVKTRNKRSVETLASQENEFRSPRSVETLTSQETVFRSPRSVETLDSQETVFRSPRSVETLTSQETVFRSPRSVETLDSQETVFRSPRSVETLTSQETVFRSPRSVETLASQETVFRSPRSVETLASQETVFRSPRSVETLDSQETVFRSPRSVETLASQETVFRSPRSVETLASQETVFRSPRSVETLASQETVFRSPRSVETLASQETVFRSPRSVETS